MSGSVTADLGAAAEALGTAIGLLRPTASGVELDGGFFADPAGRLASVLADPDQRAGALAALELLAPAVPVTNGTAYHLLVDDGGVGVSLTTTGDRDDLVVGLALTLAGDAGSVLVDVPLVGAAGSSLRAVTGSAGHPVSVAVTAAAPDGSPLAAEVRLAGPDLIADSEVLLSVQPAGSAQPLGIGGAGATPAGDAVRGLIHAVLGGTVPEPAGSHLGGVLGLSGGLPPLPLAPAPGASSAWRAWLAALFAAPGTGAPAPVLRWLDDVLALLGAGPAGSTAPAVGAPLDLSLHEPSGAAAGLDLRVGVADDGAGGQRTSFALRVPSESPGATVTAELGLADVPLGGTAASTVAGSATVTVEVPGPGSPLWPPPGEPDSTLGIGRLRAGASLGPAGTTPVLELDDVRLEVGGQEVTAAHLDLTSTDALAEATAGVLADVVRDGLGTSTAAAAALRLLGLDPPDGVAAVDAVRLASEPGAAMADHYRALRTAAAGWAPVTAAVWVLLGGDPPGGDLDAVPVAGSGSPDDPWRVPLDALGPAGAGTLLGTVQLAVWDGAEPGHPPRLSVGLRTEAGVPVAPGAPPVESRLSIELLGVDVADGGFVRPRLLGSVSASGTVATPELGALGDTAVAADAITVALRWAAGEPLGVTTAASGVRVTTPTGDVVLDEVGFPAPLREGDPDLGLAGGDAAGLWAVARAVVAAAAAALGGSRRLATLLAGTPDGGSQPGLPPVELPDLADVRSGLADLGAMVVGWVAGMAGDPTAVDPAGRPRLLGLLSWLRALLARGIRAAPGREPDSPADALGGSGTSVRPWATPLHSPGEAPVELLTWVGGDGPPAGWAAAGLQLMLPAEEPAPDSDEADAEDGETDDGETDDGDAGPAPWLATFVPTGAGVEAALGALSVAGGAHPRLLEPLTGGVLDAVADALLESDAVVPAAAAAPLEDGWAGGAAVPASHWGLVAAVATAEQVAAEVAGWTAAVPPTQWALVAVDAGLAAPEDWTAVAAACGLPAPVPLSLRVPGVDPALVDLGALPPAPAYVVDLADDGSATAEELSARLAHALSGIRAARGTTPVVLAGHSWAGLVAYDRVAADRSGILGLACIGTPLYTAPESDSPALGALLTDPAYADAVHALRALFPDPATLGEPGFALAQLAASLDGWQPGEVGAAPTPGPSLAAALERAAAPRPPLDGVPRLAVHGLVPGDLRAALRGAASLAGAAGAASGPLGQGVRIGLDLGPAVDGEVDVELTVRLDAGPRRSPLADPAGPPAAVEVRAAITSPHGWLLGGPPVAGTSPVRARWAELIGRLEPGRGDTPALSVDVELHDAAYRGDAALVVGLADPQGPALVAALFAELDAQSAAVGRVAALLELLTALGLTTGDGAGTALLADAVTGLAQDPTGAFAGRLAALLDRPGGAAGLVRDAGTPDGAGPWRYAHPELAVELVATRRDVTVRTTGDGLPAGSSGRLTGSCRVTLPVPDGSVHLDLSQGDTALVVDDDAGQVRLHSADLDPPAVLSPPDPDLLHRLAPLGARSLAAATLGAALGAARGGGPMPWLGGLLRDPGAMLAHWLGATGPGPPNPAVVQALLGELALLLRAPGSPGLPLLLGGGVGCFADRAPGGGLRLGLRTAGPLHLGSAGTTLDLDLRLDVDATRIATPGGALRLHLPLPGALWQAVDLDVGTGPDGATLDLTPLGLDTTIRLLPTVTGLDALGGGGARLLLAAALDALVARLSGSPGEHAALDAALEVAAAFGVVDAVTAAFDGARLTSLAADLGTPPDAATARRRADAVAAATQVLAPGLSATASGTAVTLTTDVAGGGLLTVTADFAAGPPALSAGLAATAGAATADVAVDAGGGALTLAAALDLGRAVVLTPRLTLTAPPAGPVGAELRPLGDDSLVLRLAPSTQTPTAAQSARLASGLALPLAIHAMLDALGSTVDDALWPGGPTPADLLVAGQLAVRRGRRLDVATIPDGATALDGVLTALDGSGGSIGEDLRLALVRDGTRYGPSLIGTLPLPAGDRPATLHLGLPPDVVTGWTGGDTGLAVLLVDLAPTGAPRLDAVLSLDGVGVRVAGSRGEALVDTPALVIGEAGLYGQVEVDLGPRVRAIAPPQGAAQLVALGIPLLPSETGANPVAASLLASTGGDQTPANPPVDVTLASGDPAWTVRFGGEPTLRLPIQQGFGPLYLAEVALSYDSVERRVGLGVSGDVAVGPLVIGLDDLTVRVPQGSPSDLASWVVDLAGLAVALASEVVSVSGGLKKLPLPGGDVEYLGALSVTVAGRNLTAVGSYAQPHDALGEYTSLFVFLSVPVPLGGPPFFFVLGLAAGVGYNRMLLVPDDPAEVPAFPLVAAVSGDLQLGDDPVAGLRAIGADLPPSRGAYWGAAGVRFTTFGLIQGTALAYVSLDTGVEVGLLGTLQLALPTESAATILSVELGLAASYSTVDQLISVRAGLTDASWLFSADCRLTGGFAFMAWLATPEVLLSIGGYHPHFIVPAHYPAVDPVGFAWTPARGISVKGESYFALTHSAVMVGGSLEAAYDVGAVQAWFDTSVDVMVTWDPFSYRADLHVGVGASLEIEACVLVCVTVRTSVDVGADLTVAGPPLRGLASVDLGVLTITVGFGSLSVQAWLTWDEVRRSYLTAGSDAQPATTTSVTAGRFVTADATAPDGTEDDPWVVGTTVTVATDAGMPCSAVRVERSAHGEHLPAGITAPPDVDVVPAGPTIGPTASVLSIDLSVRTGAGWAPASAATVDSLELAGVQGHFPSAVWQQGMDDDPAAPMLAALGGTTLTASTTLAESTGALGDDATVPLSTLVEEQPTLPLPLRPAGGPIWPGQLELPRAGPVPGRRRREAPRLLGVGVPRRQRRGGPWQRAVPGRPRPAAPPLRPGQVALWDVRDLPLDDLALDVPDAEVRVVAFSAGGRPLADLRLPAGRGPRLGVPLPRATARVAVLPTPGEDPAGREPRPAGWRLRGDLVRVGPGTLLAEDAVVLTSAPVLAAGRYAEFADGDAAAGGGAPTVLPGCVALADQPRTTTVVYGSGDVLVVAYDRTRPQVGVRGAELTRRGVVERPDRVLLVYGLRRSDGPVEIDVEGAGVSAVTVARSGPGDPGDRSVRQERDRQRRRR